mgnify:CR=1 FL=1
MSDQSKIDQSLKHQPTTYQPDPEAEIAFQQSMDLLNDAIKECQLDGFQAVESAIPQVFNQQGKVAMPLNSPPDFMSLAEQAFAQPASLFSDSGFEQQELTGLLSSDNTLGNPELTGSRPEQSLDNAINSEVSQPPSGEEGLDAINNLLNSG